MRAFVRQQIEDRRFHNVCLTTDNFYQKQSDMQRCKEDAARLLTVIVEQQSCASQAASCYCDAVGPFLLGWILSISSLYLVMCGWSERPVKWFWLNPDSLLHRGASREHQEPQHPLCGGWRAQVFFFWCCYLKRLQGDSLHHRPVKKTIWLAAIDAIQNTRTIINKQREATSRARSVNTRWEISNVLHRKLL